MAETPRARSQEAQLCLPRALAAGNRGRVPGREGLDWWGTRNVRLSLGGVSNVARWASGPGLEPWLVLGARDALSARPSGPCKALLPAHPAQDPPGLAHRAPRGPHAQHQPSALATPQESALGTPQPWDPCPGPHLTLTHTPQARGCPPPPGLGSPGGRREAHGAWGRAA